MNELNLNYKPPRLENIFKALFILGGGSLKKVEDVSALYKPLKISLNVLLISMVFFTLLGSFSLLPNPINPFLLIVSLLTFNFITLILSFFNITQILTPIFKIIFYAIEKISKLYFQDKTIKNISSPLESPLSLIVKGAYTAKIMRPMIQSLSHFMWLLAFTAILIALTIQFLPSYYNFSLGSTLQFGNNPFYEYIFYGLDFLPSLSGVKPISQELLNATLAQNLSDPDRSEWAFWVLTMLVFYGILPRFLMLTITSLSLCYKINKLNKSYKITLSKGLIEYLDLAPQFLPKVERKTKVKSINGLKSNISCAVAIDCLPSQIEYPIKINHLNNRLSRNDYLNKLKIEPANALLIIIDARQTPDRGTLNLIANLFDLSCNSAIYLDYYEASKRSLIWQEKLNFFILENEIIILNKPQAIQWLNNYIYKK